MKPETVRSLQDEIHEWGLINLSDNDYDNSYENKKLSIMGMCEHAGEICASELSLELGIRGSAQDLNAKIITAIGCLGVYVINYISQFPQGLDGPPSLGRPIPKSDLIGTSASYYAMAVFRSIGDGASDLDHESQCWDYTYFAYDIIRNLNVLCAIKNVTLYGAIKESFELMKRLDYIAYPKTGLPDDSEAKNGQ